MARLTRAEALRYASRTVIEWAASALSGKNPDDTEYTLPVSGTLVQGAAGAEPWDVTLSDGLNYQDDSVTTIAGASDVHMGQVGGDTYVATGTLTRTADTNSYAAGDIVTNSVTASAATTIANAARISAGSGLIVPGGRIVKSGTVQALSGFRLWLYISTPASIPNDNAAFTITAANNAARLGYIDFIAQRSGTDCWEFYATDKVIPFKLASGTSLLALLETLGAITTPESAGTYTIYLPIIRD